MFLLTTDFALKDFLRAPQNHLSSRTDKSTVTLSSTFEVVIPQEIRESLQLTPGEKLHVVSFAGRVELIPVRSIESMRGFLRGMDTRIDRDEDRL
jgi:AbrB family looped-hinge helix DNA binding protein